VNWSIRDPDLYLFNLPSTPEDVIRNAAGAAMREAVAGLSFDQVTGNGQGDLAARVAARTQDLLDRYRAGVQVQGVTIRQAEPPAQLDDAAKDIADARSTAKSNIDLANRARDDAIASAQKQTQDFDKVYDAYKLSPQVTRSRMYYDMMEAVLAKSGKVIVDVPNATVQLPPVPPKKQAQQGAGQ
jgi:membrane protease subunit HflK